jgi:hypothetical protein
MTFRELNPFHLGNTFEKWEDAVVLGFIGTAVRDQGGNLNLWKNIDDGP